MVNPQRQYDPLDIVANLAGVCVSTVVNSWYHKRMLERRRQARYRMLRGDASEEMPAVDIEMGLREPQELSEQDAITQPQGDRQESSGK
ncbi:hypothetical protein TRVA0_054S00320 [Trichomonascus vanleenenianus]|uniref:uncharacterized protein n=1 Tax=Trichomonascus vanleenenianus TaxID=2268995 RepID=UPI003EC9C173